MTELAGDLPAQIEPLMKQASAGNGPHTMGDIRRIATELAERVDTDASVGDWIRANAMPLIGQQLLVAAVQAVSDPASAFDAAIDECRGALGAGAETEAVLGRLMDRHPAAVRAWLVRDQLPTLLAHRLAGDVGGFSAG